MRHFSSWWVIMSNDKFVDEHQVNSGLTGPISSGESSWGSRWSGGAWWPRTTIIANSWGPGWALWAWRSSDRLSLWPLDNKKTFWSIAYRPIIKYRLVSGQLPLSYMAIILLIESMTQWCSIHNHSRPRTCESNHVWKSLIFNELRCTVVYNSVCIIDQTGFILVALTGSPGVPGGPWPPP